MRKFRANGAKKNLWTPKTNKIEHIKYRWVSFEKQFDEKLSKQKLRKRWAHGKTIGRHLNACMPSHILFIMIITSHTLHFPCFQFCVGRFAIKRSLIKKHISHIYLLSVSNLRVMWSEQAARGWKWKLWTRVSVRKMASLKMEKTKQKPSRKQQKNRRKTATTVGTTKIPRMTTVTTTTTTTAKMLWWLNLPRREQSSLANNAQNEVENNATRDTEPEREKESERENEPDRERIQNNRQRNTK